MELGLLRSGRLAFHWNVFLHYLCSQQRSTQRYGNKLTNFKLHHGLWHNISDGPRIALTSMVGVQTYYLANVLSNMHENEGHWTKMKRPCETFIYTIRRFYPWYDLICTSESITFGMLFLEVSPEIGAQEALRCTTLSYTRVDSQKSHHKSGKK